MKSAFLFFTRKFLEISIYRENALTNNCSDKFSVAQCATKGYLKFGVGELLKLLTELSEFGVWHKRFVAESEMYGCSSSCALLSQSELINELFTMPIPKQ